MKTSNLIFILILLLLSGCQKKFEIEDISTFELNYKIESGWTGYVYDLRLIETGELNVVIKPPLSDTSQCSINYVSNDDLMNIKLLIVDLLNSEIKNEYTSELDGATDLPCITLNVKSNIKQLETRLYQTNESDLPPSLRNILSSISDLRLKYNSDIDLLLPEGFEEVTLKNLTGVDCCGFVLQRKDNKYLEPNNLQLFITNPKDGDKYWIKYTATPQVSCCMVGNVIAITELISQ
jgi:hypothetical protein